MLHLAAVLILRWSGRLILCEHAVHCVVVTKDMIALRLDFIAVTIFTCILVRGKLKIEELFCSFWFLFVFGRLV